MKLLDFGIAKLIGSDAPALTRVAERLLTPEYASPGQIRGAPITTASGIYSLGVLLYELLTGQRPYQIPQEATSPTASSPNTNTPQPAAALQVPVTAGRSNRPPRLSELIARYRTG